jgi:flagellin
MPLMINTNVQSLNSQRQLVKSGMEQDQAMERLSSGKRINSAADDAAGLAISNRMTSQVRGLDRAVSNANDGISLIQTAEGALDESTNILQRMRELSIQSANGIYEDGDRATLDAEVQQLVAELDRIAETTSFNGQNLLDGSLETVDLQVGSEANQTISFAINAMDADSLGLNSSTSFDLSGAALDTTAAGNIAIDDGDVTINGQDLAAYTNTADGENVQLLLDDINNNVNGVTAGLVNTVTATSAGTGELAAGASFTLTLHTIDTGGDTVFNIGDATTSTTSLTELADLINEGTDNAISASVSDNGRLVLTSETGGAVTTSGLATIGGIADDTYQSFLTLTSDDGSAILVEAGATGTAADLESLGFRTIEGAGQVAGVDLTSSAGGGQLSALAAGELEINGVDIAAVSAGAGLAAKIDAINAASDETGVVASAEASVSLATNVTGAVAQLANTASTSGVTASATVNVDLNGVQVALTSGASTFVTAINAVQSATGVTAYIGSDDAIHLYSQGPITMSTSADETGNDVGALLAFGALDGATASTGEMVADGTVNTGFAAALGTGGGELEINGQAVSLSSLATLTDVVTSLNAAQATTGVVASIDDNGELALTSDSAFTIKAGETNALATMELLGVRAESATFGSESVFMNTSVGADTNLDDESFSVNPHIELDSANDAAISIDVSGTGGAATGLIDMNTDLTGAVSGSPLSQISVGTQAGAQDAIATIDQALETINDTRSELGAVTNRLDFTVSNLMNISENTSAARSRIMDADFAMESANLSRAQVLQQAAQAMLAQANSAPSQVLSLLR